MSPEILDRICLLHLQGQTIRSLARQFEIPKSTLHHHVKKRLGDRPHCKQGTIAIVDEYTRSPRLSQRQRQEVRQWMVTNLDRIIEVDTAHDVRLLSSRKEQSLTNSECGRVSDFRGNLMKQRDVYAA
ncbi:MAG TPA: hypothetical protein V6D18_18695 [Thermosynechococcaceae cyanobacterium]